jgi:TnpA family transposase
MYRVDRGVDYGALDPLLRNVIDIAIIIEQWDQLVRIDASLKDRLTPAHVVLQHVTNASPADRVAKALAALGGLAKSVHILRYINEEPPQVALWAVEIRDFNDHLYVRVSLPSYECRLF